MTANNYQVTLIYVDGKEEVRGEYYAFDVAASIADYHMTATKGVIGITIKRIGDD